jgi:MraZ protein
MFQGETAITIDDKGRLAIPTSYRDLVARECGNRLVVTYNPFEAGCLYLYPLPVWEKVRDQVNAAADQEEQSPAAAEAGRRGGLRRTRRQRPHLFPASQRNAVGIEKKAVLLGMGDKFELWSEQAHHEQIRQTLGDADLGDGLHDSGVVLYGWRGHRVRPACPGDVRARSWTAWR